MDVNRIEDWLAESQLPERAESDLISSPDPEPAPEGTKLAHEPTEKILVLSPRILRNIHGIDLQSLEDEVVLTVSW